MPKYTDPYTPLLVALYLLLALLATYQIVIIRWHRHKLMSFNFGFLNLCVLFCGTRAMFWVFNTDDDMLYLIMFWFPINIQFGMFYLVTLYIMKLVQGAEQTWDGRYKSLVFWSSIGVNIAFFLATIGWLVACTQLVTPKKDDEVVDSTCSETHTMFAAVCFLSLGLSLLYYGVKLHIIASKDDASAAAAAASTTDPSTGSKKAPLSHGERPTVDTKVSWGPNESRFRTEAICFLLLTVFISRAIFDLVQLPIFGSNIIQVANAKSKNITDPTVFWTYILFEIFPTALMLFFFGSAVSAAGTAAKARFYRTLTESFQGAGPFHGECGEDENDEDILETDATSALWPVPKEIADVLFQDQRKTDPLNSRTQQKGLLEDDNRYDSPVEWGVGAGVGVGPYTNYGSPITDNYVINAVNRGYIASMGRLDTLDLTHQPAGQPEEGYVPPGTESYPSELSENGNAV